MKNIGASVGVFPTQGEKKVVEKEEEEEEEVKEEEYHLMRNEMIFCLKEAPEYQISAVGEWRENARGDIVQEEADTYFIHVTTGQRCESVRDCFSGWSEQDEKSAEQWETLCQRIEEYGNLEETICDMKRVEV